MPLVPGFIPVSSNVVQPPLAGQYPRVLGATSGYFGLKCPAIGPSVDWTMPTSDSTGTQFLQSNGSGALSWGTPSVSGALIQAPTTNATNTVQPSGSTTVIPFTIKNIASQSADAQQWQSSTGAVQMSVSSAGKVGTYNSLATAANGIPAIVAYGRATAQTAANASVATFTVGASDGSFVVAANVLLTTSTSHSFNVVVNFTDEGNVSRTLKLSLTPVGAALGQNINNGNGNVPCAGTPSTIRCKAGTTITVATSGTFTTVTYNVEALIQQAA